MKNELFDINVGYLSFKNPIALASMAGITDSKFARKFSNAGLVILGGYNLDKSTNEAARKITGRGRTEFMADSPMEFLESELLAVRGMTGIAVNVRGASLEPFLEAARLARESNAILEINAHCRQPEMMELGAGQALLKDPKRLCEYITEIKKTGAMVSVKYRANVINDIELAKAIEEAGADIIHVDAMDQDGIDVRVIRKIRNSTNLFIIGNNSVVDSESAKEMFSHGADMVSVARAVLTNPGIIDQLIFDISSQQAMTGWYNAPKHICAGGDLRALAFCCLPVKPCALHGALKQAGISAEDFMKIKTDFARNTPIEYGKGTCFGSMTWCCKITKPCFLRDAALESIGLSDVEYMRIKKRLSEIILTPSSLKMTLHNL